jgi:hypothetical protein
MTAAILVRDHFDGSYLRLPARPVPARVGVPETWTLPWALVRTVRPRSRSHMMPTGREGGKRQKATVVYASVFCAIVAN